MCLLTYLPAGVQPDTDALLTGALVNADGHGFAIVAGRRLDRLIVQRGLDGEAVIDAFIAARLQHPQGPALFHSRLATHGDTTLDNCHPFTLGGDTRTVLAHNGVLPAVVQPGNNDRRCDTRIAAEQFIPAVGSLRHRRVRRALQRWMTPPNKMVILTVNRRFRQHAYILNEQSGIWHGGIWYSNDGYLPVPSTQWSLIDDVRDWPDGTPSHGTSARGRRWAARDWRGNCGAMIDTTEGGCRYCGWCLDCREMPEDCFCYAPAVLDHPRRTSRDA